ncbi:DUF4388 domain-containing protein [Acidobacteriota bacterium]
MYAERAVAPSGLSGCLKTMQIADILQWCKIGMKTGKLVVSCEGIIKTIFLRDGKIVSAASNDPREYLGQILLSSGRLKEDQLQMAFKEQQKTKGMLGKILVDWGFVATQELEEILRLQIMETVFELFLWEQGNFSFYEEDLKVLNLPFQVKMDVDYCILEGARRSDEWKRFKDVFPDDRMILGPGDCTPVNLDNELEKKKIYDMASNGKSIEEIKLEMRRPGHSVLSGLFELYQNGYISITGTLKENDSILSESNGLSFGSEQEAIAYYYEKHVPIDAIPVALVPIEKLSNNGLSPDEAFILSRINGDWTVRSIVMICPVGELKTLRILNKLAKDAIIVLA